MTETSAGFACTKCGKATKVVDSRFIGVFEKKRRRRCTVCLHTFTTWEVTDDSLLRRVAIKSKELESKLRREIATSILKGND
jgi:transcriptional regulator NrdR family protein